MSEPHDEPRTAQPARPSWPEALLWRVVRRIELDHGSLADDAAMRHAATSATSLGGRLATRAQHLSGEIGLDAELARWHALLPWLLGAAVVAVTLLASGIVGGITGHDRRINAVAALLALLVWPSLSLIAWLVGLAWPDRSQGGGAGRMLLWAGWIRGRHSPLGARVPAATMEALRHAGLMPWVLGLANHAVWILAFALILLGLLGAFAFRAYTLTWETTILEPGFFAAVVTATGWLPQRLGFAVPDVAAALSAQTPSPDQRPWAWWLIGCTLVYGLLPRLLAAIACVWVWRTRRDRLSDPDPADPYVRQLAARFARWDSAAVVDAERRPEADPSLVDRPDNRAFGPPALVGFEVPASEAWPPAGLELGGAWHERIAGTADERRLLLDRIARERPVRVLVACRASASPDRGTERFAREALGYGAQGALLLLGCADAGHERTARWAAWVCHTGLGLAPVFADAGDADQADAPVKAGSQPAHHAGAGQAPGTVDAQETNPLSSAASASRWLLEGPAVRHTADPAPT